MRIQKQSETFGLPDKEAAVLPSREEIADLLKGHRITTGLMKRDEEEE